MTFMQIVRSQFGGIRKTTSVITKYFFTNFIFRKHIFLNNPWKMKTNCLNDEILNIV